MNHWKGELIPEESLFSDVPIRQFPSTSLFRLKLKQGITRLQSSVIKPYEERKQSKKKPIYLKIHYCMSSEITEVFLLSRISNEVHTGLWSLQSMNGNPDFCIITRKISKTSNSTSKERLIICLFTYCVHVYVFALKQGDYWGSVLYTSEFGELYKTHGKHYWSLSKRIIGPNMILEDANLCKLVFYYEVNASANDHK